VATRAGQNAIAIQMMKNKIPPSHQPRFEATSIAIPPRYAAALQRSN
jgi:hypothetical protein